jgi:hypothetical protein
LPHVGTVVRKSSYSPKSSLPLLGLAHTLTVTWVEDRASESQWYSRSCANRTWAFCFRAWQSWEGQEVEIREGHLFAPGGADRANEHSSPSRSKSKNKLHFLRIRKRKFGFKGRTGGRHHPVFSACDLKLGQGDHLR